METVMLKAILAVLILLALLVTAYLGCRVREWLGCRHMTAALNKVDATLSPLVFTGSSDYDRSAATLLAQSRFLRYQMESARNAGKSVRPYRKGVTLLVEDLQGLQGDNDVIGVKRGAFLKAYVSEIDDSLQSYSVYVPESYDGDRPFPLVVHLHGHRWFTPFQGHPAPEYTGAIVLSPQGRGATDFMWIGEEDVLRTIDEVTKDYRIDEDRVFVAGTSMGGTGAWNLAVHHPRLFTGVGPRAGNCDFRAWEACWGWNRHLDGQHRDLRDYLLASDSPVTYLGNLAHTPVYVVHAAGDGVVPVEHAREAVARLRALGAPVEYREFLVGRHGDFPKHVVPEQLAWLASRPRLGVPSAYHFETRDLRRARSYYTTVLQMADVRTPATLDVKLDDAEFEIRTHNVLGFSLHPDDMPSAARAGTVLKLDGQTMPLNVPPAGGVICFARQPDGSWRRVDDWPPDDTPRKVKGLEGPVQDVLLAPFTVAVGSRDEKWFKSAEAEAWRFVAEWFRRFGTKPRVISDGAVTEEMLTGRNIVFFGRPGAKTLMRKALDRMPIQVTDDGVVVGEERFTGKDVGTIFCCPTPNAPGRMTAVFSSVSPAGLYQVYTRFGNWFNWGVHDQRKWFDYCVFDRTTVNPETYPLVGFFGTDWSFARGRSWRPTEAAGARVKVQGFPAHVQPPDVDTLYLSELQPTIISQMRGAVGFDRSFRGNPIVIGAKTYERGLGVRCPSRIEFPLEGRFKRLSTVVGFTTEPEEPLSGARNEKERIRFVVRGDDRVLHVEKVDRLKRASAGIDLDIRGVQKLTLSVEATGGALWLHGSSAWADVRVER